MGGGGGSGWFISGVMGWGGEWGWILWIVMCGL